MPDTNSDMTLTNAIKKEITSLASAKGRRKAGAFMAEGTKCVLDTLPHFTLRYLIATQQWLGQHPITISPDKTIEANRGEIGSMSSMVLAPDVIAVYELPAETEFRPQQLENELIVALDCVQDPGNLGAIIRTADWMGVTTILASADTADCFNPKVIQATMGAISRVKVIYGNLPEMLAQFSPDFPIYGTFLNGENIYSSPLSAAGAIVMGNEGKGIGPDVAAAVTSRLSIPSYPPQRPTSESLNVASATAIILSQFRARLFTHGQG